MLAQRQQFHQNRLVEHIAPSDLGYQQTIDATTRFFQAQGSNTSDAAGQAIAWVGQTLQHQIDLLAYIDLFWTLAVIGAIMVPVALPMRSIESQFTSERTLSRQAIVAHDPHPGGFT